MGQVWDWGLDPWLGLWNSLTATCSEVSEKGDSQQLQLSQQVLAELG